MRICLVSQEYPPETTSGGIGSQTYAKAHGLSALGHEVSVISASTDEDQHCYWDGAAHVIRIASLDHRMSINTEVARWLTYAVEVAATISALHTQAPFDLIDFPDWGCEGYVHLLNQASRDHVPTVIQLHGPLVMFAHAMDWPELKSEFYRVGTAMEGTCLRLADAVYTSSDCSAKWCARHYGLVRDRIPTIHTGVDTRVFSPRDVPKDPRPTIAFVGRIDRAKGAAVLVEAACMLAREFPGLQVRMIGRGSPDFIQEMEATASGAGFPDLLDFMGFIETQQLATHLSRADIFAGPSIYEPGPGLVYLEAMACSLPVIGSEGSGAAEVIRDGETGFLVRPGDAAALADSLRVLLGDRNLRLEFGTRGRLFVETEANREVCIRRLESFYRAVATGADWTQHETPACHGSATATAK
jgi:glycosyltransferase involved in cell wall biosynthesis